MCLRTDSTVLRLRCLRPLSFSLHGQGRNRNFIPLSSVLPRMLRFLLTFLSLFLHLLNVSGSAVRSLAAAGGSLQRLLTAATVLAALLLPATASARLDILGDKRTTAGAAGASVSTAFAASASADASSAARVQTEQATVTLMAYAPQGIRAGAAFELGLHIQHAPGWHTYWKNPGDSGLPTRLKPVLPAGMQSEPLRWPLPHAVPIGELVNFGYESDVLLPMTVRVAADYQPPEDGLLQLHARAYWLVCRDVCVPQEGDLRLELPVDTPLTEREQVFDAARTALPSESSAAVLTAVQADDVPAWVQAAKTTAIEEQTVTQQKAQHVLLSASELPAAWRGQTLRVFPEQAQTWLHRQPVTQRWLPDGSWQAVLSLQADRLEPVEAVPVVLSPPATASAASAASPAPPALRLVAELSAPLPPPPIQNAAEQQTAVVDAAGTNGTNSTNSNLTLAAAMFFAFLGGMVLNLMPCVFPVLAIKALSFVQTDSVRQRVMGGLAYSLGVVLSFALLGGAVWLLRTAGTAVGWGFQLQSPWFVVTLAMLFVLIALNLFGWFDVRSLLPAGIAGKQAKKPVADAFLSGVLAVAVASPCTAPLMGAALGYAMRVPALSALLVFVALGLGMALPYLLLACVPALARQLPQPGAWMEHFRQFMAFPMLMTVVWLLWVLGLQVSVHFLAAVLLLLVCLVMAVWALRLHSRARRWLVIGLATAIVSVTLPMAYRQLENNRHTAAPAESLTAVETQWQPWSAALTDTLEEQQQPYFIDFTAAWCITCQYNKANVLNNTAVKQAFARGGVRLLRADWTRQDPAITRALTALNRSGVPVYVLYRPATASEPAQTLVLSEILDREELLAALEGLAERAEQAAPAEGAAVAGAAG